MKRGIFRRQGSRWRAAGGVFSLVLLAADGGAAGSQPWPPPLPGAVGGTVRLASDLFIQTPTTLVAGAAAPGAAAFTVARTPPGVDLAYHAPLPHQALNGTGWSAWGDILVAGDGLVYVGLGDHGQEATQASQAYLFRWDPAARTLTRLLDVNAIVPRRRGAPTWSKIHAAITEGPDGNIYFSGTLNDGNLAPRPEYQWSPEVPGGQLYQYDPRSGRATVWANLPSARCTATALLDRERRRWWCNLEGGPNALFALDLETRQPIYQAPPGSMHLNRCLALARDGCVYFNGSNGLWKCDARAGRVTPTGSSFGSDQGMRCASPETRSGWIYGVNFGGQLFRYAPARDRLELLGPNFLKGEYTAACALSPDERFLYFLPGAHGRAYTYGTPVIQYELATGRRKVIAFLRAACESACQYVPGGTYGVKLSADGGTLYVNLNGHAAAAIRPAAMPAYGFGLTAFAAIHIPPAER